MALELFLIRGNSNQREKLELSDKYPAQPMNYVMEDEPVCLVLRSSEPLTQVVLWIQDLALAATDQNADDIDAVYQYFWGTPTQTRLFLNHFGSSNLTIDILSPSLGIQYRYTSLEVFATKLNAMRAEGMLNYLERKLDDIVRSCFSATHHKAGIDTPYHERHASILMSEIRNGLDVLITNRSRFIERKRSRLVPELRMQQWSSVNDISEQSIHWVLANLDVLTPSTSSSPFDVIINNRRFELERVQANVLHEDTDIYENQVVRGYLENIFLMLVEIERKYNELLVALENYDCLTDIPIGYQCLGEIRKKFGRKHYEKLFR